MNKLFISTATTMLLLAGCGFNVTEKNESGKTEEKGEKSNFVSEKEVKKELQSFVDSMTKDLQKFSDVTNSGDPVVTAKEFKSVSESISKTNNDYKSYLDKVKEPIKYTKPSKQLIDSFDVLAKFIKDSGETLSDFNEKKITEDEFNEKYTTIQDDFNNKNKALDKDFEEAIDFMKKEKIDVSKLESIFNDSEESSKETSTETEDRQSKILKTVEPNKTVTAGPVELTVTKVELGEAEVTEDNEFEFENLKVGDKAQLIFVYMTLRNTVDQDTEYYADQAVITTDTGEQLEPAMVMESSGIVTEMKGDVESSGRVIYQLKNSTVKDINSITVVAPSYNDPETYDTITPEQKITIDIK